jgi:HEAT repeat protein
MNEREAIVDLHRAVRAEKRQPELMNRAAVSLGLMGDATAVPMMLDLLKRASSESLQGSITKALGYIGDRHTIPPLLKILKEKKNMILSRTFAADALGRICTEAALPVGSRISCDLNYRVYADTVMACLFIL